MWHSWCRWFQVPHEGAVRESGCWQGLRSIWRLSLGRPASTLTQVPVGQIQFHMGCWTCASLPCWLKLFIFKLTVQNRRLSFHQSPPNPSLESLGTASPKSGKAHTKNSTEIQGLLPHCPPFLTQIAGPDSQLCEGGSAGATGQINSPQSCCSLLCGS